MNTQEDYKGFFKWLEPEGGCLHIPEMIYEKKRGVNLYRCADKNCELYLLDNGYPLGYLMQGLPNLQNPTWEDFGWMIMQMAKKDIGISSLFCFADGVWNITIYSGESPSKTTTANTPPLALKNALMDYWEKEVGE